MYIFNEEHGRLFNEVCNLTFKRLENYGSSINDKIKFSLSSLILALDGGLRGVLDQSFFLSSLPPGTGKTEAISSFVRAWKSKGFIPDSSILLCFNTKDEIRSVIDRLDLDSTDYACFTRDDSLNALGRGIDDARNARVLLTTHQMINKRTKGRKFGSAKDFFYKEGPRPLRVWDESMTLAEHVTARWTDIVSLFSAVQFTHKALAELLRVILDQGAAADDGVINVPEGIRDATAGDHGRDRLNVTPMTERQRRTLDALLTLEGRSAWQVAGTYGERALVGSSRPLPPDFAPAIITDASGAVRGTYASMERAGGALVRLPYFPNDYSNVRIHLWTRSAGKAALAREADREGIFRTIARLIANNPTEEWLIIGPKEVNNITAEIDLKSYLPQDTKVNYLNWGRHHGTNEYRKVRNLIVIGNYSYAKADYMSLEIAASGIPVEGIGKFHWSEMRDGEMAHNMLQGILRGNARNSNNGIANRCDVYLIAPSNPNMERLLNGVFPGATFDEWGPSRKGALTGQSGELLNLLKVSLADSATTKVLKKDIREAMGIMTQGLTNVLARNEVRRALQEAGIAVKLRHFERT